MIRVMRDAFLFQTLSHLFSVVYEMIILLSYVRHRGGLNFIGLRWAVQVYKRGVEKVCGNCIGTVAMGYESR